MSMSITETRADPDDGVAELTAAEPIDVLSVASEIYPLAMTGGLAEVAGALPGALAPEGVTVRTLMPGYPEVLDAIEGAETVATIPDLFGGPARLLAGRAAGLALLALPTPPLRGAPARPAAGRPPGLDLLAIDAPHLYARPGDPYVAPDGTDWPDNATRFGALGLVAARVGTGLVPGYRPHVVHGHDWQAGLAPIYLQAAGGARPRTVQTIHDLASAGQFPPWMTDVLGLPPGCFSPDGVEFHGTLSFLKAGLFYADRIPALSPGYAAELMTREHGMGFDGLLRARAGIVTGVRNGIDDAVWNPAADPHIAAPYAVGDMAGRAVNKAALQERLGLRLVGLLQRKSAGRHPGRGAAGIGQDEGLAHLIQAGADALLVPSRFEPCGLAQLCALRYGAVPVVSRVGGLADTVVDANEMALASGSATGVVFAPVTLPALESALRRTAEIFRDPEDWAGMVVAGMGTDVSWRRPARRMAALYRDLLQSPLAGTLP